MLLGVDVGWWDEPVGGAVAFDFPVVVVDEEVMVSTQEDPVFDVRFAVVAMPVADVMCFRPGRWAFAGWEEATTVSGGEDQFVAAAEEALFTP